MPRVKLWTSYAWMHRRYVIDKLTEQEMAALADTTQATINRWLIKHKLKKEKRR